MADRAADKLTAFCEAPRSSPEDAQNAVLAEAETLATELAAPLMSDAQRDEVRRRLALPRTSVSHETVRAILRRYNPTL